MTRPRKAPSVAPARDASIDQLSLPMLHLAAHDVPPLLAAPLDAASRGGTAADLLVYLRCPECRWQAALRVPPRGRRREPRLEALLPRVPVRHWVFSLGESAQPYLAPQPRLRTQVARACVAAVFASQRRAAARSGVPEPWRCGAVSAIHRVGTALEANVHVHALVLDGVYAPGGRRPGEATTRQTSAEAGPTMFHPLPAPRRAELRRTLAELRATIASLLARGRPPRSRAPAPRASTRDVHRVATRPPVQPVLDPGDALVHRDGELDVRAGAPVAPDDEALRARLCRYVARPPFDPSALEPGREGRLRYRLHHPFADGTTHVELTPHALAERLQALAAGELRPPVAFHGVLAPRAAATVLQGPAAPGDATPWAAKDGPAAPGDATPWAAKDGNAALPGDAHPWAAQQLALLELPPRPSRSRAPALRCPRCRHALEVVSLEPAPGHQAA